MAMKKVKIKKTVDGKEVEEIIEVDDSAISDVVREPELDSEEDEDDVDDDGLDYADAEKVKAEIKKLRTENAKARLKRKELAKAKADSDARIAKFKKLAGGDDADDEKTLEEKLKVREKKNQELEAELHMRELEGELQIPKENSKYFRYLLQEAAEELAEGEELDEDQLQEIVKQVKAVNGKGKNSTGLNSDGAPPPGGDGAALTVEKFAEMNLGERSALYTKNQKEYERLMAAAREKKLLK
jgi:hypothetical protein